MEQLRPWSGKDVKQLERMMDRAWRARTFQSAALLAAVDGEPLIHVAFGQARLDTIFDLASLTKPLATTAALMLLVAEGKIDPQEKVTDTLELFRRPETRVIRIHHLLTHSAGLTAWRPFYEQAMKLPARRRRLYIREQAAAMPLVAAPGTQTLYSDLGFILLDWLLEQRTGQRLDQFFAARIARPLGLSHTFFIDLHRPAHVAQLQRRFSFAPTERCPWRGRRLQGEVHDDNCHALGGVSGHAGLFSTAHDVHLLARELALAAAGGHSLFDRQVVRHFFSSRSLAGSTRVFGWDNPSTSGSSAGRWIDRRAVGHLGFTGTSLWLDYLRSRWVILLSNRVYFGRDNLRLKDFRPRLHDAFFRRVGH